MKYKIMVQHIDYPMGSSPPYLYEPIKEYSSEEEVCRICKELNDKDDLRVANERKKNPNYSIFKNYFFELVE